MKEKIAFALTLALLFVWSLPGTIALRALLLFGALTLATVAVGRSGWRAALAGGRAPLLWLGALTAWLLLQAVAISPEPAWALGELRGQWLNALLALALGLAAGRLGGLSAGRTAILATGIALVFAAQGAIAIGQSVAHAFRHGALLRQEVPLTGGKLEMSFLLNLLLAFVLVDLFGRAARRGRLLALPLPAVLAMLGISYFANYLGGARNGIIGAVLMTLSALYFFVFDQRQRLGTGRTLALAAALTLPLALMAGFSVKADARWQVLPETARIAWDIDTHSAWQDADNRPLPTLADGRPVDISAYTRIAWLHVGLRQIAERPLGVGYGRNAFRHALDDRHEVKLGHAHSGVIDLGVGGGAPALLLWFGFLAALAWRGWRAFRDDGRLPGLLLVLLAAGYATRMVVDSVNRDHMLQIFMFIAAALLMLATTAARDGRPPPPLHPLRGVSGLTASPKKGE